jgi:tetratricopeptide (TPR) repeat protein
MAMAFMAAVLGARSLSALDFTLHVVPDALLPLSEDYSTGAGLSVSLGAEALDFLSPFIEGGLQVAPINRSSSRFVALNGGAGLGLFAYPTARLKLGLGVSGGLYGGYFGQSSRRDLYWKGSLNAGYRVAPGFSVLVDATWWNFLQDSSPLLSTLSVGISADINLGVLGARSTGFKYEELGSSPVFPIEYASYAKSPVAKVRITNTEQAEIRNVRVSFTVGDYSAEAASCASIPWIGRGQSVEVPLLAVFNTNILSLTDSTKMQGTLRIDYELLGVAQTRSRSETLSFNHRNALTWSDPAILGAFVSQNDPAVLDLSKYVSGLVRDRLRPDLDKPLQFGMGLFEALRLLGLKCAPDPSTPYAEWHRDAAKVDYLQYPYQTLSYKGGDSDDMAVLYAAALESVDVKSALILLDDEVLVAIRLDLSEARARSSFLNAADLVYIDGVAWLPIEVSRVREGFIYAWQGGAAAWRAAQSAGKARFLPTATAWASHPPIGLTGIDYRPPRPESEQLDLAFENAMGRFIAREAEPRARQLIAEMGSQGTGKQYNGLGILYARYGLFDKARAAFQKSVDLAYAPAVTNLANVAFLLKDFEAAIQYYEAALRLQPENKTALIGLARAKYEVDAYAEADVLYGKVVQADPALAARYAYLSSHVDASASRASAAAADRGGAMSWDEEP